MIRNMRRLSIVLLLAAVSASACSDDDDDDDDARAPIADAGVEADGEAADAGDASDAGDAPEASLDADAGETPSEAQAPAPCPADMQHVEAFCIDRHEAPNVAGALPLVMFTFDESAAWCAARGKRLCFDDEWTRSCAGPGETSYPYGSAHVAGICNDDEPWKLYDQGKLNAWPWTVSKPSVESLSQLLDAARAVSTSAKAAADHVEWLYQADPGGTNAGCAGPHGVFDLCGNVEEWTRRRDGGSGKDFSGSLKGRYWAEPRTCQSAVTNHGNAFRFYEIGFRCCRDAAPAE
jgi:formylglycine-generating enzyme required for sulfatase activity